MSTSFQVQKSIRADFRDLLSIAESQLANRGFRIVKKNDEMVEVTGPGLNSTKQDPLLGASMIRLSGRVGTLNLEAELGGAQFLSNFVRRFPFMLCIGLAIVMEITFALTLPGRNALWFGLVPILAASPWIIIGPLMAKSILKRTENSLETFLHNLSMQYSDSDKKWLH